MESFEKKVEKLQHLRNILFDYFNMYGKEYGFNEEEIRNTPDRISRMYLQEYFQGIEADPTIILGKTFDTISQDLVIQKDIPFVSVCAHHLVPFIGIAHIGYIPDGKLVGLSKLGRLVDCYSKRPQLQEKLTHEIADALFNYLKPQGCMVVMKAEHSCITTRGVYKPGSKTITSAVRGIFLEDPSVRKEFIDLLEV